MNNRPWTDDEISKMASAYKEEGGALKTFARKWSKVGGRSATAIRLKLEAVIDRPPETDEDFTRVEYGDNSMRIVAASEEVWTQAQVMEKFGVDSTIWEVSKWIVKAHKGYRKDRKGHWEAKDGVGTGWSDDTGNILVVTMYNYELQLTKKVAVSTAKTDIEAMVLDMEKFAPRYPKLKYPKLPGGVMCEIDFPDLHVGRLTWAEESGEDYDIKIAKSVTKAALEKLLGYARMFDVKKILLPVGNDFFNVNDKNEETVHGTRQQEDTRWQKTFRAGRQLMVEMIDACASIAPVDVIVIAGNHDEERVFYLGDSLASWYRNSKDVTVDNGAAKRKYYAFGKNLIGFTHGYYEKLDKLPALMPIETKAKWAESEYREWHLGDKHHLKNLVFRADEGNGITIRVLRSLAKTDTWTFDHGFVGALNAAEMFVWHPTDYLIGQFTAAGTKL